MNLARHIRNGILASLFALVVTPVGAQNLGVTQTVIVTIDSEQVFNNTSLGRQITTNLEAQIAELASENNRIATALEAEELDLTERRPTMEPAEFRTLADAFDQKVRRVRNEQDTKQRNIQALRDSERQSFIDSIAPILSAIARDHGALLVLERRGVLLSADSIDITREAIERIEAALNAETENTQKKDDGTTGEETTVTGDQ